MDVVLLLPSSNRAVEAFHPKSSSRVFLRRPAPQRLPLMALANLPSGWHARRTFHRWPAQDAHLAVRDRHGGLPPRPRRVWHRLRRETEVLREAVARAARDLSSSAHALDRLADIVSQGKEALSIIPSSCRARRPLPPPPPGPTSNRAASRRSCARSRRIRPRPRPISRTPRTSLCGARGLSWTRGRRRSRPCAMTATRWKPWRTGSSQTPCPARCSLSVSTLVQRSWPWRTG